MSFYHVVDNTITYEDVVKENENKIKATLELVITKYIFGRFLEEDEKVILSMWYEFSGNLSNYPKKC